MAVDEDALYEAILEDDTVAVQHLLSADDVPEHVQYWALVTAIEHNPTVVPLLLECGVDINARDDSRDTVLMNVAAGGDADAVRWLLDHGAEINARNDDWETPFSYACAYNRLKVARLLHERGADVDCIHRQGGTPINDTCSPKRILEYLASIGVRHEEDIPAEERPRHIGNTNSAGGSAGSPLA